MVLSVILGKDTSSVSLPSTWGPQATSQSTCEQVPDWLIDKHLPAPGIPGSTSVLWDE